MINIFYFFCMLNLSKALAFKQYTSKSVGNDAVHLKQCTYKNLSKALAFEN